jgi:hypothetical protein
MDNAEPLIERSRDQLNRVLGFFPRVDAVSSVLLGVNIGMLALLANNMLPLKAFAWYTAFAVIPIFLIGISLIHLYRGSFPKLDGGWRSLIYFREIAQRSESEFTKEFSAQSHQEYVNDLLSQVWRNSEILTQKFNHLRLAFIFMALAIVPWVVALALFSAQVSEATTKTVR